MPCCLVGEIRKRSQILLVKKHRRTPVADPRTETPIYTQGCESGSSLESPHSVSDVLKQRQSTKDISPLNRAPSHEDESSSLRVLPPELIFQVLKFVYQDECSGFSCACQRARAREPDRNSGGLPSRPSGKLHGPHSIR